MAYTLQEHTRVTNKTEVWGGDDWILPRARIENAREGERFGEIVSSVLEMLSLRIYWHIQIACPISYRTHTTRAQGSLGIVINRLCLMDLETLVYSPLLDKCCTRCCFWPRIPGKARHWNLQERGSGKSVWFTHQNSKGQGTKEKKEKQSPQQKQVMGGKQKNEEN